MPNWTIPSSQIQTQECGHFSPPVLSTFKGTRHVSSKKTQKKRGTSLLVQHSFYFLQKMDLRSFHFSTVGPFPQFDANAFPWGEAAFCNCFTVKERKSFLMRCWGEWGLTNTFLADVEKWKSAESLFLSNFRIDIPVFFVVLYSPFIISLYPFTNFYPHQFLTKNLHNI